jgi:hypothetical protein
MRLFAGLDGIGPRVPQEFSENRHIDRGVILKTMLVTVNLVID